MKRRLSAATVIAAARWSNGKLPSNVSGRVTASSEPTEVNDGIAELVRNGCPDVTLTMEGTDFDMGDDAQLFFYSAARGGDVVRFTVSVGNGGSVAVLTDDGDVLTVEQLVAKLCGCPSERSQGCVSDREATAGSDKVRKYSGKKYKSIALTYNGGARTKGRNYKRWMIYLYDLTIDEQCQVPYKVRNNSAYVAVDERFSEGCGCWKFNAYTYREGGNKLSYNKNYKIDGVAIGEYTLPEEATIDEHFAAVEKIADVLTSSSPYLAKVMKVWDEYLSSKESEEATASAKAGRAVKASTLDVKLDSVVKEFNDYELDEADDPYRVLCDLAMSCLQDYDAKYCDYNNLAEGMAKVIDTADTFREKLDSFGFDHSDEEIEAAANEVWFSNYSAALEAWEAYYSDGRNGWVVCELPEWVVESEVNGTYPDKIEYYGAEAVEMFKEVDATMKHYGVCRATATCFESLQNAMGDCPFEESGKDLHVVCDKGSWDSLVERYADELAEYMPQDREGTVLAKGDKVYYEDPWGEGEGSGTYEVDSIEYDHSRNKYEIGVYNSETGESHVNDGSLLKKL